ncbi:MAG: Hsp33 family molecular chaperone HslO [Pseudomonadota bacterium]
MVVKQVEADFKQRFVFDEADVRGCYVNLSEVCDAIQATHHYPPALAKLINEFAAAAVLLRDAIKIKGSLTIQLRTEGAIKLLMADCFSDGKTRAICEYDQQRPLGLDLPLHQLTTPVLTVTITPDEGERYQSIIPIESITLAACLEDYFARSEQLPSRFKLMAEQDRVVAISLHALPPDIVKDTAQAEEIFSHLGILLDSLQSDEASKDTSDQVLTKLFHADHCRSFAQQAVYFGCECSEERSLRAIISLGREEVEALIAQELADDKSSLMVDCHFCFQRYEFSFDKVKSAISI